MEKPPPARTYEEDLAAVKEHLRAQAESGRPARSYEELVASLEERIRRSSDAEERAQLERHLREFKAHEAKAVELRGKLAAFKARHDKISDRSPAYVLAWMIGVAALLIIGAILAKHYL